MAISSIDELLAPDYVASVRDLPMDEVRARRDACQDASDVLSYLRRIVQGRLDVVNAELESREGGAPADLGSLVEQLKRGEILADGTRSQGTGRLPHTMLPADPDGWIMRELDEILGVDRLRDLPECDDAALRHIAEALRALERKVSDRRAQLHERTNCLQEEIVRRYRTGEASVEALLGEAGT